MAECGIDIIEISRIQRAVKKNERFLAKVFSKSEIEYFLSTGKRMETLAGFFAAKEAYGKYKKTGLKGLTLSEISVEHQKQGAPYIAYKGKRQNVTLSISHNKTCAVAVVLGEEQQEFCCDAEMKDLIPKRDANAHKGDCGRVLVVAGSEGMTGAAVLCALGALRAGSGLVTVAVPKEERHIVAVSVPEAITVGLESKNGMICERSMTKILSHAKKSDAVVFGPGLGKTEDIKAILKTLLCEYEKSLVIDADGLNALSHDCDTLKQRRCSIVITPHPGEMARLIKKTAAEVNEDRMKTAVDFAQKYGVCVVLKGKNTVIADEKGNARVNNTGNCGMATGGTGDVLSGVITSFLGQGLTPFEGASLGTYIHGKAGDIAAKEKGIYGMIAGDVAETIPLAIKTEIEG